MQTCTTYSNQTLCGDLFSLYYMHSTAVWMSEMWECNMFVLVCVGQTVFKHELIMCAVCHMKCARKSGEGARSTFQSSTSLTQATDRAHVVKPLPLIEEVAFKRGALRFSLNCLSVFVSIRRMLYFSTLQCPASPSVLPMLSPVGWGQHKMSHGFENQQQCLCYSII